MKIHLARNIRLLRREKKLSQQQLAGDLQTTRNKIASYERMGVEPSLALLIRISTYFQISIDDLLRTGLKEEEIKEARAAYLAGSRLAGPGNEISQIMSNMNTTSAHNIHRFINRNERAEQMLEGFKVFHKLKSSGSGVNSEVRDLFLILEDVIEANKTFVDSIKQ